MTTLFALASQGLEIGVKKAFIKKRIYSWINSTNHHESFKSSGRPIMLSDQSPILFPSVSSCFSLMGQSEELQDYIKAFGPPGRHSRTTLEC